MKIQILNNTKYNLEKEKKNLIDYFKKHGIDFTVTEEATKFKTSTYTERTVNGFNADTGKPQKVRYLKANESIKADIIPLLSSDTDIVMFVRDLGVLKADEVATNWTEKSPIKDNTIYIEIIINDYMQDTGKVKISFLHETMHALCFITGAKDEMDMDKQGRSFYNNDQPDNPDSNFAFTMKSIKEKLQKKTNMKTFETYTYKKMLAMAKNNKPNRIVVHHSGGTDKNPLEDTSHHTAKIMEDYHLSLNWQGLGYHYVIHKNGDIFKGRPEHVNGAHTVKYNKTSIGICLSGNFDLTLPTEAQIKSLKELMLDIKTRYDIISIEPHRASAKKTCYGNKLSDTWASDLLVEKKPVVEVPKAEVKIEGCEDKLAKSNGLLEILFNLLRAFLGK